MRALRQRGETKGSRRWAGDQRPFDAGPRLVRSVPFDADDEMAAASERLLASEVLPASANFLAPRADDRAVAQCRGKAAQSSRPGTGRRYETLNERRRRPTDT